MAAHESRRWYLVGGVVVIAVAVWLLLASMGVAVPGLVRIWPGFVTLGALASVLDFFVGSRRASSLGQGVAGLGLSWLLFGFTFGWLEWRQVGGWWPALPLIAGLALLTSYVAGKATAPLQLILGTIGLGLGLTFFAPHVPWLDRLLPPPAVAWGILLLLLGGVLVWRTLAGRRDGGA